MAERVFRDEHDEPLRFYIHQSVTEPRREKVIDAIKKYGGEVATTDRGVNTVIVDPRYGDSYELQIAYHAHSDRQLRGIRVEDTTFVFHCIKAKVFNHAKLERYPMRGNRPGRTAFTDKDDQNLCRYLSIRIPNPESGGRLGHRIYEELVDLARVMPEAYSWAARHPPESWRQRYRSAKNRPRFDDMIQRFALREKPTEEQLYPLDRRLNPPFPRQPPLDNDPEEEGERELETYEEYWQHRGRKMGHYSKRLLRKKQRALREGEEESSDEESAPESENSVEEHHRPSSLFSVYSEPGPESNLQNQVPETTYSSPNRSRRHAPNEPGASQVTLIGSGTQYQQPATTSQARRAGRKRVPLPPSSESSPDGNDEISGHAESPQRTASPIVLDPVQDSPRRSQRPGLAPSPPDHPYRHTRARTRSANPPSAQVLTTSRQVKTGRKKSGR